MVFLSCDKNCKSSKFLFWGRTRHIARTNDVGNHHPSLSVDHVAVLTVLGPHHFLVQRSPPPIERTRESISTERAAKKDNNLRAPFFWHISHLRSGMSSTLQHT